MGALGERRHQAARTTVRHDQVHGRQQVGLRKESPHSYVGRLRPKVGGVGPRPTVATTSTSRSPSPARIARRGRPKRLLKIVPSVT